MSNTSPAAATPSGKSAASPCSETVPDSVLDLADEIVLIDLTPEQLRSRLAEGKVYLGERARVGGGKFLS